MRALMRIERPAGDPGGDHSAPMPQRAARALPRLRREHARFREAAAEVEATRDTLLRRLDDPRTPGAAVEAARPRFEQLAVRHPTPEEIASQEVLWKNRLERLERWAERDPDHAAAMARRRAASRTSSAR